MKKALTIVTISLFFLLNQPLFSQVVSFSHLNTSNGLSDNYIQCISIDNNGFLWVGTSDGLNIYDGYSNTILNKSSLSGLPSDTIRQLYCDKKNRIWVTTPGRVAWSDEEKKFHPVTLPGNKEQYSCYSMLETASYGMVLFTPDGHFSFNEGKKEWERIEWLSSLVIRNGFNTAVSFAPDEAIYVYEEKLILIDYRSQKIVFQKKIQNAVSACRYNSDAIAVATRQGNVYIIDITTQQDLKTYHIYNEIGEEKTNPRVSEMVKTADGSLAIATLLSGLIMIDSLTGNINVYQHDPLQEASLSTNMVYRVFAGKNGDIIVGTQTAGANISNIYNKRAVYKKVFRDRLGNIFDGHINEMKEDRNGLLWICGVDRLIQWDKKNNRAVFYPYFYNDQALGPRNIEMRSICIDRKGRIWVGAIGAGLTLFDQQTGKFRLISADTSLGPAVKNTYVNDIYEDSDGNIWTGSYGGMYIVDPNTYRINTFREDTLLKELSERIIISFYEDAKKRMWIGTQRYGIYCYDKANHTLTNYSTGEGLLHSTASAITGDKLGNIYTSHINGFSVISPGGTIRHFSRANGMRNARCESILVDDKGYVWIANNKCLVRYDPQNNKLEYFEENAGIPSDGFRFDATLKTSAGELYFGTQRGISYFDPAQIKNYTSQLRVNIYQVTLPDSVMRFAQSPIIKANYTQNSLQFYFTAINLTGSRNIAYEYMLEGYDKDWQKGNDLHSARYPSLPAGKYLFRVKASIDRINWTSSDNEVSVKISPPLWQRWWFIAGSLILLLGIIITLLQLRINRVKYKERLKTIYNKKISETEMKALRAQMNPHFIFNSLNSINKYILKSDHTNASRYLTRFAKLIRLILDNSNNKEVALSNELEALKLYIEMESLRFTNKFSYEILVDDNVSADTLQVPPLIIQPYVENAIWHGLLHKEGEGRLSLSFKKSDDNILQCIIEDNGVGRAKAKELKSKSATANKSLGMKLTEERINTLNQYGSLNASIEIIDLKNETGEASGTRVILCIPI